MILIIDVCKHRLHRFEFVKPIEDIIQQAGAEFITKRLIDLEDADITLADKIVICGTSLKDDYYLQHLDRFKWIKTCGKPILGICAGFQIIGLVFGGKLENRTEIGFFKEDLDIPGIKGAQEVYHLHHKHLDFKDTDFNILSKGDIPQAIKHKTKSIYGVLFHPEVRQKTLFEKFIRP